MGEWIAENKSWIFSGLGIFIISAIITVVKLFFTPIKYISDKNTKVTINNNAFTPATHDDTSHENPAIAAQKGIINILFVDDDSRFKVVKILQKAGWANTKSIKDIESLDDTQVRETHIFFVDIQGVGISLGFKDEGLGLALALKDKYPDKKVIIYSSETKGERFHSALRKADDFLAKNAEPYEFQTIVENYAKEIIGKSI